MTALSPRPSSVAVGVWLLVTGAVLLIAGGLVTATVSFDLLRRMAPSSVADDSLRGYLTLYRFGGGLFALAGVALAALALRLGRGDPRARRSAMVLALVIVVLIGAAAVLGIGFSVLALLGLLPMIAGVLTLNRPSAVQWFAAPPDPPGPGTDG